MPKPSRRLGFDTAQTGSWVRLKFDTADSHRLQTPAVGERKPGGLNGPVLMIAAAIVLCRGQVGERLTSESRLRDG